ncbi:hypothetical protein E2C01_021725 [Portunus trituberculatus]|uniref:Uncharacterized protein n=1 Tax=Portunus trituberculatus TaxID=210409 RepID=A0A5B7E457_PORTR|nr:hypothetical protein [Portunus trituberculatus]
MLGRACRASGKAWESVMCQCRVFSLLAAMASTVRRSAATVTNEDKDAKVLLKIPKDSLTNSSTSGPPAFTFPNSSAPSRKKTVWWKEEEEVVVVVVVGILIFHAPKLLLFIH